MFDKRESEREITSKGSVSSANPFQTLKDEIQVLWIAMDGNEQRLDGGVEAYNVGEFGPLEKEEHSGADGG